MARSIKTFAHALTLAQSDKILTTPKADYSLSLKCTPDGKVFTLRCGAQVNVVKAADHGGVGSVRSIADQLCERLAQASGASVGEMVLGEQPRAKVALNLEPISVASKAKK